MWNLAPLPLLLAQQVQERAPERGWYWGWGWGWFWFIVLLVIVFFGLFAWPGPWGYGRRD